MRKYRVIGKRASFEAENDQIAAVALATVGDLGFMDRFRLEKFPACWTEDEFEGYLNMPLDIFTAANAEAIAEIVKTIK